MFFQFFRTLGVFSPPEISPNIPLLIYVLLNKPNIFLINFENIPFDHFSFSSKILQKNPEKR